MAKKENWIVSIKKTINETNKKETAPSENKQPSKIDRARKGLILIERIV